MSGSKCERGAAQALMIIAAALSACTTTVGRVDATGPDAVDEQLVDGSTTRQQIISRFGEPQATYEHGLVATYAVVMTRKGIKSPATPGTTDHTLVLVFDGQGVLSRHSVVRLR